MQKGEHEQSGFVIIEKGKEMVHKAQYQMLADAAAREQGGYALHIGKIGEETFVYTVLPARSEDFNPDSQTIITVNGDDVSIYTGEEAQDVLDQATLREFSTGRAIFKKYQTLVKNKSAVIGEGLTYAQAIVDAVASKAIKPSTLYKYLEVADHNRKKLEISGSNIHIC